MRKYVLARSLKDAVQKEKLFDVDDAWLDEEWAKSNEDVSTKVGL